MKKVIALALAMAMAASMTSMALSLSPVGASAGAEFTDDGAMLPGETYLVTTGEAVSGKIGNYRLSTDWTKGSALVDSAKLVENKSNEICIEIELKENYTIEDAKDLEGTFTVKDRNSDWEATYELKDASVANKVEDVDGASKRDDATVVDVVDNTIYKMSNSGWVEFCGDGNRLSSVKVRLPEDKKVFAYFNEDPIEEVEDKYYDLDADISYINFVAKPNLGTKAEIAIQGDYSDKYHLYEYAGGKL